MTDPVDIKSKSKKFKNSSEDFFLLTTALGRRVLSGVGCHRCCCSASAVAAARALILRCGRAKWSIFIFTITTLCDKTQEYTD